MCGFLTGLDALPFPFPFCPSGTGSNHLGWHTFCFLVSEWPLLAFFLFSFNFSLDQHVPFVSDCSFD